MSTTTNDSSTNPSATKMAEETASQKIQVAGKTIPSRTYQRIPPKDLGIKVRTQPQNEDDIEIESVAIYNPFVLNLKVH